MRNLSNLNTKKEIYTEEQAEIINGDYKPGSIVRVNAFAGTGKTYTLKEFAKKRPIEKMLYVAFNKSIQLEASKKMGKNVLAKTAHSLAYGKFGFGLKHKLAFSELKPLFISKYFDINNNFKAMLSYEMVKKFMQSLDMEINYNHFPDEYEKKAEEGKIEKEEIFNYASQIWEAMIDPENEEIQAVHDVYLKLYQLSKPKLNYSYILLDESQDTTPCVFDIVMNQKKSVKLFVGDRHQSIYGFRGAANAMEMIDPDYDFELTKSFRFLPEIADKANMILSEMKNIKTNIKGNENIEENKNRNAYIARTNSGIFLKAIETSGKLFFVGGINGYRFTSIFDIYNLWTSDLDKINNPFIKMFENFEEYVNYGEELMDVEVLSNVKLIKSYGKRLPGLLYDVRNRAVEDESEAELILSTAHKSKGSEWDYVDIADDYFPIFDEENNGINKKLIENPEEINLLYVTITRAKRTLNLNHELNEFINLNKQFDNDVNNKINQIRRDYP